MSVNPVVILKWTQTKTREYNNNKTDNVEIIANNIDVMHPNLIQWRDAAPVPGEAEGRAWRGGGVGADRSVSPGPQHPPLPADGGRPLQRRHREAGPGQCHTPGRFLLAQPDEVVTGAVSGHFTAVCISDITGWTRQSSSR